MEESVSVDGCASSTHELRSGVSVLGWTLWEIHPSSSAYPAQSYGGVARVTSLSQGNTHSDPTH